MKSITKSDDDNNDDDEPIIREDVDPSDSEPEEEVKLSADSKASKLVRIATETLKRKCTPDLSSNKQNKNNCLQSPPSPILAYLLNEQFG